MDEMIDHYDASECQLIDILSRFLSKKKVDSRFLSENTIILAKKNQVGAIVYYMTRDSRLLPAFSSAIMAFHNREKILNEIIKKLPQYFIVKGHIVARYYPVPALRTMGDCDIIVKNEDKSEVEKILLNSGMTKKKATGDGELHFVYRGFLFELHHRLLYEGVTNSESEVKFLDKCWNYVNENELDVNYHFIFVLIHLKKHLLSMGVGIRQFMDLAVMSSELDPQIITGFLKEAKLTEFAGVCSALTLYWFGVALPVETPVLSDAFLRETTHTILEGGIFGYSLPQNYSKVLVNNIDKKGKFHVLFRYLFPTYSDCCGVSKYSWVENKPYLLPVVWIYRLYSCCVNKCFGDSVKHIRYISSSDKVIEEHRTDMNCWGLYK